MASTSDEQFKPDYEYHIFKSIQKNEGVEAAWRWLLSPHRLDKNKKDMVTDDRG